MAERKKWTTADEEASHRLADEEEEDWFEVYKRQTWDLKKGIIMLLGFIVVLIMAGLLV